MGLQELTIKAYPKMYPTNRNAKSKIPYEHRNTVKVAVLKSDRIKDLVSIFLMTLNLFIFFLQLFLKLNGLKLIKKIYSKNLNKKVILLFLQPNFVDGYNQDMNIIIIIFIK